MILSICTAIFLPILLGFSIIAIILRSDSETPLGERIGLSFPLGAGIITLQIFLLGLMRIPLTLLNTTTPVLAELVILAIWIWRKRIAFIPRPVAGLFSEFTSPGNHWVKKCAFVILIIWIGVKLGSVFLETGLRPIFAWDSWANWSAGAKVFLNSHSLMLDASVQDFFGRNIVQRNIFYPLHNTLMQVWMSLWIGTFDDVFVKFFSPVYLVSLAICLYYVAAREINRLAALALLVIFLSSPLLSYHSVELYSDQMLGIYLLLASVCFLKAMRGNAAYWLLAGIFSTESMFTKNEALFFVAPLLLSAIVYFRFSLNKSSGKSTNIIHLFAPFLVLLPWYAFKSYYGLGLKEIIAWHTEQSLSTWIVYSPLTFQPIMIGVYFNYLVSLNNFNVITFFFPVILLAYGKISKEIWHLLIPVFCYMLFFLLLLIFYTPCYSNYPQGIDRTTLTYYPTIFMITILLLKKFASIQHPRLDSKNT